MVPTKTRMRDAFIEAVTSRMEKDPSVFFLSADFGSPKLDILVRRFPERFFNVGIAEQNLINVAAGMALEGCSVVAYAIAPFLSMRCYEQTRVNLCLLSQVRSMNVTLAGVGAGYSYDVSGPTHQALEDLSIMRALPNMGVYSPSDSASARVMADWLLGRQGVRYVRMDGKELFDLEPAPGVADMERGFRILRTGGEVVLVATGYMTHTALEVADWLGKKGITVSVVDMLSLSEMDHSELVALLTSHKAMVSMEEGFIGKGGLDALLRDMVLPHSPLMRFHALGLPPVYRFDIGSRDDLLSAVGLGVVQMGEMVESLCLHSGK